MIKAFKLWWLTSQLHRERKLLAYYVENSAFDVKLSTYDYRKMLEELRRRVALTKRKLEVLGVTDSYKDL